MFWQRLMRTWRSHPWRFLAMTFVAVLCVAGVERGLSLSPRHEACWIWATGDYRDGDPIAFYAARDFELGALEWARLSIAADETYVLYVNGRRIGSGSYRDGEPLDEYEVGDFLEVGLNRILVELRSARGAGGLLVELLGKASDAEPAALLTSDRSWKILRRHDPGYVRGWSQLDEGEPPQVWQRGTTGRWRLAPGSNLQTALFQDFPPFARQRPMRMQQQMHHDWVELEWPRQRVPALGPHQLFDWGEVVEGYLSLDLTYDRGQPGLIYYGFEPPDPQTRPPDAVLLTVPGRFEWEDSHPRRFRYALVVGAEPYSRVEVDLLGRGLDPLEQPLGGRGVFGISAPRSYLKIEETVWKRLESGSPDEPLDDEGAD